MKRRSELLRGSSWVMAGFIVQALTGALFWLLAAQTFEQSAIGLGAALFSSLQFVNYLSALGLQEVLARFPPEPHRTVDALLSRAIVITSVSSLAAGLLYLATVSSEATRLLISTGAWGVAGFVAISAGTAVALLVDVRLMAARRWSVVAGRLAGAGLARLPLLAVPAPFDDAIWLFVVVLAPIAVSGLVTAALLRPLTGQRLGWAPLGSRSPVLTRYAGANWIAELSVQAPQFVLPVIVLVNVSPRENASFFLAWTIASVVFVLPVTVGRILLVEQSRADRARTAARTALAVSLTGTGAALAASVAVVGPAIHQLYGDEYERAAELLPGLVVGGIPWALVTIGLSRARWRHDHLTTVLTATTLAVTSVGAAPLLVRADGAAGAVEAWILANAAAAAVNVALSRRRRSPRETDPGDEATDQAETLHSYP